MNLAKSRGAMAASVVLAPSPIAPQYRVVVLHPAGWRSSYAAAINQRGDVVGTCSNGLRRGSLQLAVLRAFRWRRGRFMWFPSEHATSLGQGLNDRGGWGGAFWPWVAMREAKAGVAGAYKPGLMRGFYITPNGRMSVMRPLAQAAISQVRGVSPNGTCVGTAVIEGRSQFPVIWRDGVPHRLTAFGGRRNQASAVNARGTIVGTVAQGSRDLCVVWTGGRCRPLPALGGPDSEGAAINICGDVAGWSTTRDGSKHAARWSAASASDLGTLGGRDSFATGINDRSDVVGYSTVAGSDDTHACVWRQGRIADLNGLCRLPDGLLLTEAHGINNRGWIVAKGRLGRSTRACLLIPLPSKRRSRMD